MEGYLALMIPILALTIPIVAIWTKHQQRLAELQLGSAAQHNTEDASKNSRQVQALEERVRVLERIVTDGGYNVAAQIEALRDARPLEDTGSGIPLRQDERTKVQ